MVSNESVLWYIYEGGGGGGVGEVHTHDASGPRPDGNVRVPDLEQVREYKLLSVLEACYKKIDCLWSVRLTNIYVECLLYGQDRCLISVTVSNQFALPLLSYLMWTQHWPLAELRNIDREDRNIIVESGGKHPCGSTSILYLPIEKGGRDCVSYSRNTR